MFDEELVPADLRIAIEGAWAADTSPIPEAWSLGNPAAGHCEVTAFVLWEHLGGDLVTGQVFLDGEFQEHHQWNRVGGVDVDLTFRQFRNGEEIIEIGSMSSQQVEARRSEIRPELAARIDLFRGRVAERLGRPIAGWCSS